MKTALLACALLGAASPSASAQSFDGGWYIVEACAEFTPTRRGIDEGEIAPSDMWIGAGESVLAVDRVADGVLVFEFNGRASIVRRENCLTAVPDGRPAYLLEEVALLDRTIGMGSCLWVIGVDTGSDVATVLVDGGERTSIPMRKLQLLRQLPMSQPQPGLMWRTARR